MQKTLSLGILDLNYEIGLFSKEIETKIIIKKCFPKLAK